MNGRKSIAIAFVLFLAIRASVVEAFKIPTSSMEGTLLVGDFLLVNKAVYGPRIPGADIPLTGVFPARTWRGGRVSSPARAGQELRQASGRCGAATRFEMRDKRLYLNGAPVDEPYARYARSAEGTLCTRTWSGSHTT